MEGERRAQQEKEEAQCEKEEAKQNTTLEEYPQYCHTYLSKPFSVQTDKSMSTGGTAMKTDGKCYPCKLCYWDNFLQVQQGYFKIIYSVFHPSLNTARRFFDPRLAVEYLCRKANLELVAGEDIKPDILSHAPQLRHRAYTTVLYAIEFLKLT